MMWIFLVLAWAVLARVVIVREYWRPCAARYGTSVVGLSLAFGQPVGRSLGLGALVGLLAAAHFWALVRFIDSAWIWWPVLVIGFLLVHAPAALF